MCGNKRILSLFSGCGGMDIGFHGDFTCLKASINESLHPEWIEKKLGKWVKLKRTVFDIVFANDIRDDAKTAWSTYFKKKNSTYPNLFKLESIVNLVKKAQEGEKMFPENVDLIIGGFPCQDFSIAGSRKGFESTKNHNGKKYENGVPSSENRGKLYVWMKEVISLVKPKLFIAENVKGLVSLKDAKNIIEQDFSDAGNKGYLVVPAKILQAANYGVPQSRERIFFFGFRKDALKDGVENKLENISLYPAYDPYPTPTHSYSIQNDQLYPFVKSRTALEDLVEPENSLEIEQAKFSKAKFISNRQGNIEINLDSVAPTIRSEHHGNIEFRRLSLKNGGKYVQEIKKGKNERRLTIRECARLQTFPDDYQFIIDKTSEYSAVSASSAYKIIGNAVPCVLAYNIAQTIQQKWDLYFK